MQYSLGNMLGIRMVLGRPSVAYALIISGYVITIEGRAITIN